MRRTPKMRVKPAAATNRIMPMASPLTRGRIMLSTCRSFGSREASGHETAVPGRAGGLEVLDHDGASNGHQRRDAVHFTAPVQAPVLHVGVIEVLVDRSCRLEV